MSQLTCQVTALSSPWRSTFTVSQINGPDPTNTLFLYFTSPALVSAANINVGLSPWQQTENEVTKSVAVGEKEYRTAVKITTPNPMDLGSVNIDIGVEEDTSDHKYVDSFTLYDQEQG